MRPHLCLYILLLLLVIMVAPPTAGAQSEGGYSDYLIGSYLLEKGEVAEAVEYFERAWRVSEGERSVGLKLAETYYLLKNFTRCEMVIDQVIDASPEEREALLMKAKVRYIQRDPRSAIKYLESVRAHHPASFEVERLLGNIYYELNEVEDALEAYRRCLDIDPSSPYIQYRYGRLLTVAGRLDEAEVAFRKAHDIDPSFAEPRLALIDLLIERGREDEALPLLEEAVEADPRNERGMLTLANIYLGQERYDEGVAMIESWRSHSPLSQEGEVLLGRLKFETGDFEGARSVFAKLQEANPESAELVRILAEVELGAGNVDVARSHFERAIEIDPSDYRSHLALFFAATPRLSAGADGTAVVLLDEEERRALLVDAAAVMPGGDFDANYLVGVSFMSLEMLDEAEMHLLRARELRSDDYRTLFNLATVFEKKRDYARAETFLVQMLEVRPDDPVALNFYGYLLSLMQKDLPHALEMLQRALAAEPDNGYFLDSLGWIYYQMGDYGRAVVELEKATEIVRDDPVILEHLGDAYAALRRFSEARSAYERSHELQGGNEILEKIESTRGKR